MRGQNSKGKADQRESSTGFERHPSGLVNRGENLDDLFQVGCIGLMKAIDNFDITLDVRFPPMRSL